MRIQLADGSMDVVCHTHTTMLSCRLYTSIYMASIHKGRNLLLIALRLPTISKYGRYYICQRLLSHVTESVHAFYVQRRLLDNGVIGMYNQSVTNLF